MTPSWTRAFSLVAVGIATIALAGCSFISNVTGTTDEPSAAPSGTIDVFDIVVGDCLTDSAIEGELDTVVRVDCAEPHAREAYASIALDDGDYPGDDAVEDSALTECTTAFAEFVGLEYNASVLEFAMIYPTAGSWDGGDREITCLISDAEGDTTGSLENAQR